ncbi:hypothetical protein C7377_1026 [Balneicella halophila]|uniref:Rod shape-determining protein MreD n=1 Tax=Balneicella halophila TaxID=1537566 RepID=A0A7L4UNF5_BALHA|nr:hypothetical protein [Balneicella halophila]PVX50713.1 hypothetical protein C7377_1026 [Balneicella halophila]
MSNFIKNIIWWTGVLLLQMALLLYFRPTMVYTPYIFLILLFRILYTIPRTIVLLIAFLTGLFIDAMVNSWGVHAFSAVFIVFIQPAIVNVFSQQALGEESSFSFQTMGKLRYTLAMFILLFIYHALAFILWNFNFNYFFFFLYKAFVSSAIATFIILLLFSIFKSRKELSNE